MTLIYGNNILNEFPARRKDITTVFRFFFSLYGAMKWSRFLYLRRNRIIKPLRNYVFFAYDEVKK